MADFRALDMGMDGDVDVIDFLGFHSLTQDLLEREAQRVSPKAVPPCSHSASRKHTLDYPGIRPWHTRCLSLGRCS